MLPRYLTGAILSVAVAVTALPAAADTYANPHLLVMVDELATDIRTSSNGGPDGVVIVDVRSAADYAEGHVPGARQIEPDAVADPNSPIAGALRHDAELAAMIGALGISADTEVVL